MRSNREDASLHGCGLTPQIDAIVGVGEEASSEASDLVAGGVS